MFDEAKIQTVLLMVFGVVVLVTAIAVVASAKRAKYSDTARVGFNVVVGMVLLAIGLGAIGFGAFGTQILEAFGFVKPDAKGGN